MDALELLTNDHNEVKKLLDRIENTGEADTSERRSLFEAIRAEMEVHEAIEEEIFYPELKEHPKAKEVVLEGFEEHHVVDRIMGELSEVPFDDETWSAKLSVMKENIEHHIEEEEGEMFDAARDVFGEDELGDLGERMAHRKEELKSGA